MVIPAVIDPRAVLLALPPGDSDPTGGHGPEWGKAAPIGLLVLLLMGVALFLLIKSMNRNLRKVPASFDTQDTQDTEGTDGTGRDGRPGGGAGVEGPVGDGGDGDPVEGGDGNPGDAPRGGAGDGDLTDGDTRATASS